MLVTATVFLVAVAQVDLSRDSTNATDYRIKVSWGQCLIGIKAIVQKVLYPSELSFWQLGLWMDYEKGGRHRFHKLASLDRGSRQYSGVVEVQLELFIAMLNSKTVKRSYTSYLRLGSQERDLWINYIWYRATALEMLPPFWQDVQWYQNFIANVKKTWSNRNKTGD